LTVTSLTEFEQVYGLPQNAAERLVIHSVKAISQSPANVLVTRLPYGGGQGSTVADSSSVQVYPVIPRPQMFDLSDSTLKTIQTDAREVLYWDSGDDLTDPLNFKVEKEWEDPATKQLPEWDTEGSLYDAVNAICATDSRTLSGIWTETGTNESTPEWNNYTFKNITLAALATSGLIWTPEVPGDEKSVPAYYLYQHPAIGRVAANVVNKFGWDLNASDRYYLGEPSNIELNADEYTQLIKGQVKLKTTEAGKKENQTFSTFSDIQTKGGIGALVINNKKFITNEKFEGYYVGLSDNTNLNPATDFDSVGKLKSLSKKLGGTGGGYVDVPDESSGSASRLTFSLSAGYTYDQFGNRTQVGLDGSISEVLENLSDFDLGTDEFSDILTLGVFKIRQSTLEPDANKLDYMLADSVVGSVNHFRERYLSSGGSATSFFIESEAEGSPNLMLKLNDGMSKDGGNWLDGEGMPTKKIRILPAQDVRYFDEINSDGDTPSLSETATLPEAWYAT
jgi:hypothetical protein